MADKVTGFVFLWGYLKERNYAHKPYNLIDLKDGITEEKHLIEQDMLTRVQDDFRKTGNLHSKGWPPHE